MGKSYPRMNITNIRKANSTFIVIKASVSHRTYTKHFINEILLLIKAFRALFCLNHPLLLTLVKIWHVSIKGHPHITYWFVYNQNIPTNQMHAFISFMRGVTLNTRCYVENKHDFLKLHLEELKTVKAPI